MTDTSGEAVRPQSIESAAAAHVTVVVPCYNEETRLDTAVFEQFLRATPHVRLLFVDDGSKDGTFSVLQRMAAALPEQAQVLRLEQNQGKAQAVSHGIRAAIDGKARYVGFWDADLATPLEAILEFERILDENTAIEMVLGARVMLLGRQIERSAVRHYLGRIFATTASLALNVPVYDTQCGAKLFRVNLRTQALFERPFGSRWVFDVEMLARYLKTGGTVHGLYECAVPSWRDVAGSKVKPSDFFRAIGEISKIYQQYPLGQPLRALGLLLTGMFSRYVFVGALGTALHYGVLIAAVELVGASPGRAATAGATVGAIANYFFNYHFTFTSRTSHTKAFVKFIIVALVGVMLSGYGVRLGVDLGMHYVVAQVICTVVFLVLGYYLNKLWTF